MNEAVENNGSPTAGDAPRARERLSRASNARGKRTWLRRIVLAVVGLATTAGLLAAIGLFALHVRLSRGPIDVQQYLPRIDAALEERFGHGYDFDLKTASIVDGGAGPALDVGGLTLKTATGRLVFSAPSARLSVSAADLIVGRIAIKRLEAFDLELRLVVLPNGDVAIAAGTDPNDAISLTQAFGRAPAPAAQQPAPSPPPALEMAPGVVEDAPPAAAAPRGAVLKQVGDGLRQLVAFLTGPDSPLSAVERIGASRARLVIDDRAAGQNWVFDGLEMALEKDAGGARFRLSAQGPSGRWRLGALAKGAPGEQQTLQVEVGDISRDEIAIVTGARNPGFDFDMPVSAQFDIALQPTGVVETATGRFSFGSGYFRLDDPDHAPLMIDELTGGFIWNGAQRRFDLQKTQLFSRETHAAFTGTITPPPSPGEAWSIEGGLDGPAVYGAEKAGDKPIELSRGRLKLNIAPERKRLRIEAFEVGGPDSDVKISGDVTWFDGPRVKLDILGGAMPVRSTLRLWPGFVAPSVRTWLMNNLTGGAVESVRVLLDFDGLDLRAMRADKPLPRAEAVAVDFTVADGKLEFLSGAPPLQGLKTTGHVTGRTTDLTVAGGYVETRTGARLNMLDGKFTVPDAAIKPTPAKLATRISGNIDAVADLLNSPALKPYATIPLDAATIKGQIDGRFGLSLMLGNGAGPDSTHMNIQTNVTNFGVQRLVGKEGLDNANLAVSVDPSGVVATGQGRIFGAPAQIEMRKPADRVGEASISLTLDEALRAKHGFGQIPGLSGPVGVRFVSPLGAPGKPKALVEMDLTRAGLDGVAPGVVKPAGQAAKLSFAVTPGEGPVTLENLVFEGAGLSARGSVDLQADGSLAAARLSQVKVSPGDDMRVDVTRSGSTTKVVARGSNIDARPFLKSLFTSGHGGGRGGSGEIELDLKSPIVTGYNKQIASGVELRLTKRGDTLRSATLSGRFGRDALNITSTTAPGGGAQVHVGTADAGSLLSFLDIYKRMEGGLMALDMRAGEDRLDGVIVIRDFVLRDEPALRRLVNEAPPQERERARVNPTLVQFQRFSTTFAKLGSRIELRDATIYSPSIGTTAEGWVDFARDRLDVAGTFVPAYGLNNLLARIPVVGVIIGGGSNEGVFGVNYRLTGSVSSPTLNVNPLSALAPGIFRKIFGAGQSMPTQTPAPTPTPGGANAPMSIAPRRAPQQLPSVETFSPER